MDQKTLHGDDDLADGIAIIGLSGKFPGADDVHAFWENLVNGVESISRFSQDELEDSFPDDVRRSPKFVAARPVLEGVDQFDAEFFGMYAREADLTDPQHRIFLECAWQALEDGGVDTRRFEGDVGVFGGCSMNTYFMRHVCQDRRALEDFTDQFQLGHYPMLVGAGREFLSTRVSYKLDLRGPSFTVQSACSTSLLAVAQACQSLQLHQCDMALAGGVSISFPQRRGYLYLEGGMASADGHCRAFDADASGTVFGSGAGVVLLRRLADAKAAGDRIYAVIRGCGINNDGAGKVGYTAPSVDGQADAIAMAMASAGVDARSIAYVECHGTATPLGDPIEIAALTKAFRAETSDTGFCAIGSVKSNVGHLDAAAGVTGLIKTALSLYHQKLPPTLHFRRPNPRIDLENSPFFVNAALRPWPRESAPRRAGVSSLGVGGTNVHVVLEEAPASVDSQADEMDVGTQLLVLSARSEAALAAARARLASFLCARSLPLADVAWTLQSGRREFDWRCAVLASDGAEAASRLGGVVASREVKGPAPSVVFLFPGQGAQYPQMGRGLYRRFPVFEEQIDRCAEILRPLLGYDLRALLFPQDDAVDAGERLRATAAAQPALFCIEYALARLLQSWGIEPAAMVGHSVGEFVAATLAGVFSLEEALAIIAARARLMQSLPGGAMLAVRLPEAHLGELLDPGLSIAAVNGPSLCVVAGSSEDIAALELQLQVREVVNRRLHTSHAFHSPAIEPIVEPLRDIVAQSQLSAPRKRLVSCVSGDWLTDEQANSPDYWARHARERVRFADALASLLQTETPMLLIEVGPGNALSSLALQAARGRPVRVLSSMPDAAQAHTDESQLLAVVGEIWSSGITPDWSALHASAPNRVSLPTYPFQRRRHWIDSAAAPRLPTEADPDPYPETVVELVVGSPSAVSNDGLSFPESSMPASPSASASTETAHGDLVALLEELSGQELADVDAASTFLELGFDSLFLTQVAQRLQQKFGLQVTFRQLLNDYPSIAAVASLLPSRQPASRGPAETPVPRAQEAAPEAASSREMEAVFRDQLKAMSALIDRQLETLRTQAPSPAAAVAPSAAKAPATAKSPDSPAQAAGVGDAADRVETGGSRFQVYSPTKRQASGGITPLQRRHIDELVARSAAQAPSSKAYAQRYRSKLADPRAVAGFRSEWKELVFPIVAERAAGSKIWDIDGNEYIDLVNGYGQTFFGHAPDFVVAAVQTQLAKGFAIGPQAEFAGRVATSFCEVTGHERATFCNTGSEAVMAAMRVARSVTGRDRVVMFGGDYHGQFDEVLVKGVRRRDGEPRPMPVASGIPQSAVSNMVVLEYGSEESLNWIRAHAGELAAIVVEPVQSRHPALQPFDFLRELRRIADAAGTALVIDEVVTGFRVHPAGIQGLTGIRADLATYGKVVGGGMPIGILAGNSRFMDALDGGQWRYGDDSFPEVGVTFFAGTFVRHPLVLAAVSAVLERIQREGQGLQERLAARTAELVRRLRELFVRHAIAAEIEQFSSLFFFSLHQEHALAPLFYHHLRLHGVHLQDGFPCFLTTAHSDADLERIVDAFRNSFEEMALAGIFSTARASSHEIPLTESQTEVWLAAQLGEEVSCAFNESITLRIDGLLDVPLLQRALEQVVARHDSMHLRFAPTGEFQWLDASATLSCPLIDLSSSTTPAEAESGLQALVADEARTPFDLGKGPLLRAQLVRLEPRSHALILTAHHIVCDGWSVNVLVSELMAVYAALRKGSSPGLEPAARFEDYARSQASRTRDASAATRHYWLQQYATLPHPLNLPTDRPRPRQRGFSGATRSRHIDRDTYQAIKKAGAAQNCTLFSTLLAGFQALIGRLADSRDIVVGVPTAGQSLVGADSLVGHCVNFLPLRVRWEAGASVGDFLKSVSKSVLDAYEHQDYTLATLVRELALPRDTSRLPLTELQFNLERLVEPVAVDELQLQLAPNPKAHVNYDLFLNIVESSSGLRLDCDYNTGLFDATTIDRWLDSYETLLQAMLADPARPLAQVGCLPQQARRELLVEMNATAMSYPQHLCVHQLFEAQAARVPEATAVIDAHHQFTYEAMNRRANRIAHHLRARLGQPDGDVLVAVGLRRTADLPAVLLAIWKAGYAYVPLDLSYPPARVQQILGEAAVSAVVTDETEERCECFAGHTLIRLDREATQIEAASSAAAAYEVRSERLAYVIYTSGSTGTPKGVEVTHRAVVNFLSSMARRPGLAADDRLLAITTLAFDIAVLELFLPLSVGASVVIAAAEETADGFSLLGRLQSSAATAMQATPSHWRMLLEAGFQSRPGLRMFCGGEPLSRDLADSLLRGGGQLWNLYGPTETTVWSACAPISAGTAAITVGHPIANTQFYVLDTQRQPLPLGVPGELYIGGDGVARGYHRRPDLSAERFVDNPFGSGRLYRTGDLAQRLPGGDTQVLGRLDQQVKLRGFRIELGEIEAAIARQPDITAAAVAVCGGDIDASGHLVAFYAAAPGSEPDPKILQAAVAARLPAYMVPVQWQRLDAMPLTPNGKLDRAALPRIEGGRPAEAPRPSTARPADSLEASLLGLCAQVLRLDGLTVESDLLSAGADSIQLFQIVARARKQGHELSARQILQQRNVAALARHLRTLAGDVRTSPTTQGM